MSKLIIACVHKMHIQITILIANLKTQNQETLWLLPITNQVHIHMRRTSHHTVAFQCRRRSAEIAPRGVPAFLGGDGGNQNPSRCRISKCAGSFVGPWNWALIALLRYWFYFCFTYFYKKIRCLAPVFVILILCAFFLLDSIYIWRI